MSIKIIIVKNQFSQCYVNRKVSCQIKTEIGKICVSQAREIFHVAVVEAEVEKMLFIGKFNNLTCNISKNQTIFISATPFAFLIDITKQFHAWDFWIILICLCFVRNMKEFLYKKLTRKKMKNRCIQIDLPKLKNNFTSEIWKILKKNVLKKISSNFNWNLFKKLSSIQPKHIRAKTTFWFWWRRSDCILR